MVFLRRSSGVRRTLLLKRLEVTVTDTRDHEINTVDGIVRFRGRKRPGAG